MHRGKEKRNLDPLKKSDSAGQEEEEEEEKGLKKKERRSGISMRNRRKCRRKWRNKSVKG